MEILLQHPKIVFLGCGNRWGLLAHIQVSVVGHLEWQHAYIEGLGVLSRRETRNRESLLKVPDKPALDRTVQISILNLGEKEQGVVTLGDIVNAEGAVAVKSKRVPLLDVTADHALEADGRLGEVESA
jgi:hypothetical protein